VPAFLDTSIVLSRLFHQVPQLPDHDWNTLEDPHASELIRVESCRVIERQKLDAGWSDQTFSQVLLALDTLLSGLTLVTLDSRIFWRACQPFGIRLKTLDAIHLSTALLICSQDSTRSWTFFAHDEQLKNAARLCGLQVKG
jgi:hypothetical protein